MQKSLFPEAGLEAGETPAACLVEAAAVDASLLELAGALPPSLRLGTSSWHYPGWAGLVWARHYPAAQLSRHGLPAYTRHPLLRTVCLDRNFHRALDAAGFARHAAQVPADFRFVVKAPKLIADAALRDDAGHVLNDNPRFLDLDTTLHSLVEPALAGLGHKLGVLLFQLSPLPAAARTRVPALIARLHRLLVALPNLRARAAHSVVAVEVRDQEWLTPLFIAALRDAGASYCLGLHARMPPLEAQLPVLRALWPAPLVCRWNLHAGHGAFGYEAARREFEPFDRLRSPDPATRAALARVIAGAVGAGQPAYVTLDNKAEGSAPLSLIALAQAVREAFEQR